MDRDPSGDEGAARLAGDDAFDGVRGALWRLRASEECRWIKRVARQLPSVDRAASSSRQVQLLLIVPSSRSAALRIRGRTARRATARGSKTRTFNQSDVDTVRSQNATSIPEPERGTVRYVSAPSGPPGRG
jgi:hypothetical protein